MFPSDALGLNFFPPPPFSHFRQHLNTNQDKLFGSILKVMTLLWTFVMACLACVLFASLWISTICPRLAPLFGCTFSYWMTDQVHWSVQGTCHGFELRPVSALLQSQQLPTPPEVTVAWGREAVVLVPVVILSLALWFFPMTSPLDPSLIMKIRLQQNVVKSQCHAHMVDFCDAVSAHCSVCCWNAKIC